MAAAKLVEIKQWTAFIFLDRSVCVKLCSYVKPSGCLEDNLCSTVGDDGSCCAAKLKWRMQKGNENNRFETICW